MGQEAGDYQVEYAKSNRSTCLISKEKIAKGALRIALLVQSKKFDGLQPMWHSWTAFKKDKKRMTTFQNNCRTLWGIENLKPADQKELQSYLKSSSSASSSSSSSSDGGATSEQAADPKYQEFMKESEMIWKVKEQLKKEQLKNLKEMLELNDQLTRGGEDIIIDRCAFGMLFGKLPSCGVDGCENGQLRYYDGKYKCSGKTAWGNCSYSVPVGELDLGEWDNPDDIDWKTDFMNDFRFKKHIKCDYVPNRQVNEKVDPSVQKQQKEQERQELAKKLAEKEGLPLGNYVIAFSGKLSMKQAELQEMIEEHGAEFSATVDDNVDLVIATAAEYAKDTNKIKAAKERDIPILEEDFIHQSIEQEKKLDEEEKKAFYLFEPATKRAQKRRLVELEATEEDAPPTKKARKINIKGRAAVHEAVEDGDDLHVYDEGGDKFGVWSVNLNKVDIQKNRNSYYILQLLEHDKKKRYYVFRKWGRLGSEDIGDHKLTDFEGDLEDAKSEFETVYEKQTGNSWDDRRDFKKQPGRMFPVEVDYGTEEDSGASGLLSDEQQAQEYKGSLDPRVRDFIRLIFDIKQFRQALKQMEIDTAKMPLGKLSKKNLKEGFSTLTEIAQLLSTVRKLEAEQVEKSSQSTSTSVKEEDDEEETKTPVVSRKGRVRRRRKPADASSSQASQQSDSASQQDGEDVVMGEASTTTTETEEKQQTQEELDKTSADTSSSQTKSEESVKSEPEPEPELKKEEEQEEKKSQESQSSSSSQQQEEEAKKTPSLALKAPYRHKFLELSNKFYTIVPHVFGPEGIKVIDNEQLLKEKTEMVETLLEMEVATTLVLSGGDDEDPIDTHYKALKTKMAPLNPSGQEYKMVNDYLQNTHASTHRSYSLELMDAFAIDREGETERFVKWNDVANRQLLWHGSRITNWTGILSQGLRIAPPEAPVTGYMFGKGVYFANMSSKSANYCFTNPQDNIGILILSEVVLGDMYERLNAEFVTPEQLAGIKKLSTWGKGRTTPDPNKTIEVDSCVPDVKHKVGVPLGTGVNSNVRGSSLLYDEMIVYDVSQIKIRYLLKVKFNYGSRY